jgi:hypothetical protein
VLPKLNQMTKEQLSKLHLNKRVSMWQLNRNFEQETKFGYVTKIYNGNHQVQVWFDGEQKPRVVGYTRIELVDAAS